MAIGILLGNFVDSVGPSLQKGKFVGVSVPIGKISHAASSYTESRKATYNQSY